MARLSRSSFAEPLPSEKPIETILEHLLLSPPPEKPGKVNAPFSASLGAKMRPIELPMAAVPISRTESPRTCRPQTRRLSQEGIRTGNKDVNRFALAAAAPVKLPSKPIGRTPAKNEERRRPASSASVTSETLSTAASDSFVSCQEDTLASFETTSDIEPVLYRKYWPKYDAHGGTVIASVSQDAVRVNAPVQTVSEKGPATGTHRGSASPLSGSTLPVPINLAAASHEGKLCSALPASQNQRKKERESRSSMPPRRTPSPSSCSSDEDDQQVKTVEETLKYLFTSLQSVIPDVLEACENDGTAAFDKLQQMQDANTDAALASAALHSPPKEQPSLAEKVSILAEQYSSVSRSDIEVCLHRNSEDLDRASADLLTRKFESDAKVEANDRALAEELSFPTATDAFQTPVKPKLPKSPERKGQASPAVDLWLTSADETTKKNFAHLQSAFPAVQPPVLQSALRVSGGDLHFAADILKGEGHTEVAKIPMPINQVNSAPPEILPHVQAPAYYGRNSPPPQNAFWPGQMDPQAVYEKHRADVRALSKEVFDLVQKQDQAKKEGKHHQAMYFGLRANELKYKQRNADNLAKENIFESMNKHNCAVRQVDLHGLHIHEAIQKVHELVEYSIKDPFSDTFAKIVTGRGKGSPDQISRLRPAVEAYLEQRGILHGLEPGNNGVVCINITRGQILKPYHRKPWK